MRKLEKKILKMIEKDNIGKAVDFAIEIIREKDNEQKAEIISALGPLFIKNRELDTNFPDELYELLINHLDNEDWIVRRNILLLISSIAELYIEKVIEKESLHKIKLKATKDKHWAVRVDGIKALGKVALKITDNSQIIFFLGNQTKDTDPEIRIAAIESLASILKKYPEKINPNLHIFVNRFNKDDDYRVSLAAEDAIKGFAELNKN